jgi:disulfide bond formation protein DsbB
VIPAKLTSRKLALAGFLVCAGLIGIALYLEHFKGLDPCPLCMIQRLCYYALGGVLLIAAIHGPSRIGMRIYAALAFVAAAAGIGFSARHVWLQWNPPDYNACTADLFYQLKQYPVLRVLDRAIQATGDCAKVDWTLLKLSIAEWSLIWFVLLAVLTAVICLRRTEPESLAESGP